MKNFIKLFGIIALAAVIGFSMAACGGDDDDGGNSSGDTYRHDAGGLGSGEITFSGSNFSGSNWTLKSIILGQQRTYKGTYVVQGTTIICTVTESDKNSSKQPGYEWIWTILSPTEIRDEDEGHGEIYTKK